MKTESKDFMTTEYDKISTAYFGLSNQITEMFKAYLTLIGLPLTVLAAVLKFGGGGTITSSLTNLPDIVAGLLFVVSLLGLFVTFTIISMRMEMILYARTINSVRGFFADTDQTMGRYLVLPTVNTKPSFYEALRPLFWQILMIGFMDGIIMGVALLSLLKLTIFVGSFVGIVFWFCHWLVYWVLAQNRKNEWNKGLRVHGDQDKPKKEAHGK